MGKREPKRGTVKKEKEIERQREKGEEKKEEGGRVGEKGWGGRREREGKGT